MPGDIGTLRGLLTVASDSRLVLVILEVNLGSAGTLRQAARFGPVESSSGFPCRLDRA